MLSMSVMHQQKICMIVYNVFPPITTTERVSSSLIRSLCLKCYVWLSVCVWEYPSFQLMVMRRRKWEKGREGSKEKTKREGKNKQEVEEVKRIKDNVGSKKEAGRWYSSTVYIYTGGYNARNTVLVQTWWSSVWLLCMIVVTIHTTMSSRLDLITIMIVM